MFRYFSRRCSTSLAGIELGQVSQGQLHLVHDALDGHPSVGVRASRGLRHYHVDQAQLREVFRGETQVPPPRAAPPLSHATLWSRRPRGR